MRPHMKRKGAKPQVEVGTGDVKKYTFWRGARLSKVKSGTRVESCGFFTRRGVRMCIMGSEI